MPADTRPVLAPGSLAGRAQPVLSHDGLVLRPWELADAPTVEQAYDDPAVRHWHARSMTAEEARAWVLSWAQRWSAEEGGSWAVTDGGGALGRVGFQATSLADGQAHIAYWTLPAARGRRLAPRAVQAVSRWCFDDLGLHRLELRHSTQNTASCRVALAAGYPLEGTARRSALHADGWHDMHVHASLADG